MRASRRRAACRADGVMYCRPSRNGNMPAGPARPRRIRGGRRSRARMQIIHEWLSQTTDVGQYAANPWGFFDMHGNVYEWTADRYEELSNRQAVIDPTGPASGSGRVLRGGSWSYAGRGLRSANRINSTPSTRRNNVGFRVGFKQQ